MADQGYFKKLESHKISDLVEKDIKIKESDLCIQSDDHVIQYEYIKDKKEVKKYEIKPGVFTFVATNSGLILSDLELRVHDLLDSATNSKLIKDEVIKFFDKLDVYKRLNKDPRRAILLYSAPGMGKSSTIAKLSSEMINEDKGTVVIFWDTSSIRSSDISSFLSSQAKFLPECSRLLFVMEDIGGGNVEGHYGPKSADASLLELLDGASAKFSVPTFIIATTNTPENLLKSLADRPGRFDEMFELEAPSSEERVKLLEYIAKRKLTKGEIAAGKSKNADGLSIAHLSEIVIRSELNDKTFAEVIDDMKNHKKKIEKAFHKVAEKLGLV